MLVNSVQ
ncbi:unnamed protein product [Staurois parvus]|nr:unnamed protein product [Staurois parvus]